MVFVGQGTYGCVYRPPLKCKNGKQAPSGKISKLMVDAQAKKEVNEYKVIEKIDPSDTYYPGKPIMCKADPNDIIRNVDVNDCDVYNKISDPKKYSLLFYDDGGIDLGKFVKTELDTYLSKGNNQVALFFVNAHHLFKGLHLFAKNNFLHHDLKPGNIVFEPASHKFKFIDFGLSAKSDKLISNIIANQDYEHFHWSYPIEFGLMDALNPYYYDKLTLHDIKMLGNDLRYIFKNRLEHNKYSIKPDSFFSLFKFSQNINENMVYTYNSFVDGFINGLTEAKQTHLPLREFIKLSVLSADTYALGFTMNHMINSFYMRRAITDKTYNEFRAVFEQMFNPNFMRRVSDTEVLLNLYEKALLKTGMMFLTHQTFKNHNLEHINDVSTETPTPSSLPSLIPLPLPKQKRCPKGTRRNKKSGNCESKSSAPTSSPPTSQLFNINAKKTKRCPNGTRKDKVTGQCIPK